MITVHVSGTVFCKDSFISHQDFDFDGQNDAKVENDIRECFFAMKDRGAVNVNCVTEDSQCAENSAMPWLRWGKPYMFNNGGNTVDYVAELGIDEVTAYLVAA